MQRQGCRGKGCNSIDGTRMKGHVGTNAGCKRCNSDRVQGHDGEEGKGER